jgi:hypothetical protein
MDLGDGAADFRFLVRGRAAVHGNLRGTTGDLLNVAKALLV